jgi:hypothetical protein
MCDLLPPVHYLSYFYDRIQCHRLPAGLLIECLVYSAHPFHYATKDPRTTCIVWHVQTRPLRHFHQSGRTWVLVLRHYLDTLPDSTTSHWKQHELRRSAFGCYHYRSTAGLDIQWSQEVQDPYTAENLTLYG